MISISRVFLYTSVATLLAGPVHAQEPVSALCAGTDAVSGKVTEIVEADSRVFALTTPIIDVPDSGGLFVSCSEGGEWYKHPDIVEIALAAAVDPGGEVFAGSGNGSMYRSADYGTTWEELTSPDIVSGHAAGQPDRQRYAISARRHIADICRRV